MPPPAPQSAARLPSLARYGVRAVDRCVESQKTHGEAMYTAPTLRSACSSSSCKLAMPGVEGNAPRLSLGVPKGGILFGKRIPPLPRAAPSALQPPPLVREIKREHSLRKENTPFDKAAPIHMSILTPCVSMVMMHPAMVTPRKMIGTARFKRISSTAAMSAPVHAPVPGNGMATKSSSPHV